MTPKQRYLAAVRGEPRDRPPVTPIVMAWAAHYVGKTYRDYQLDGDVLVEAQLAVARAFGLDQVSTISDPWREASGYGMEFDYPDEGVGIPRGYILNSADDVARLEPLVPRAVPRMRQRLESVAKLAAQAGGTHSVLGWVEGPVAEYVDLRGMTEAMTDLMDGPEVFHKAAAALVATGIRFAAEQVRAGADTIGVGDATASLIGPQLYAECVLPWEKRLIRGIHDAGGLVKLHICGNIRGLLPHLAAAGADIVDVDWMVPLDEARQVLGERAALAGNFDPAAVLLRGAPADVAAAAHRCIAEGGDRFLLQPGCEVPPSTPEANLRAFCKN